MRQAVTVTLSQEAGPLPYRPAASYFDEAIGADGPRLHYVQLLTQTLRDCDLRELADNVQAHVDGTGCSFHGVDADARFVVDPIPRIIPGDEWAGLEAGLTQRMRALNAFLADAYGARACVGDGVVPADVIERAGYFEPDLVGWTPPGGLWTHIGGLDVVRGDDGRFCVLEDNLRTPSGQAYLHATRTATHVHLPTPRPEAIPRGLHECPRLLADTLQEAAPEGRKSEPFVVVLTDGRDNSAFWEHRWLARAVGAPLVELDELEPRAGRLWWRRRGRRDPRPVDVVYRRTNLDRLRGPDGRLTAAGEALLEPLLAGTVAVVNAFGTGIADDKLAHAYVEDMIRYFLGEEPLIASVPTYDLGRPDVLAGCCARLDELVVKPRTGHGGIGVVIGPRATRPELAGLREAVRAAPTEFVAQELVRLSRHPTVIGDALEPRHVDLRPFVLSTRDDVRMLPGALTRVAFGQDELVVNSSQNGGAKDTWVLP